MKKGLIICIILLVLLTYCNIIMYREINQEWHKTKAELDRVNQKYDQVMKELYCRLQTVNLFSYIQTVNPRLSNKEIAEFVNLVFKYSDETGVDPYEIFAKCRVESDFDPKASGAAGEKGFLQVMPETFKLYLNKFGYTVDNFNDWRCTLRVGIAHYAYLMNKHGRNHKLAEAEYNAGSRGNWMIRAKHHVQKVLLAKNQVSRYRERRGSNVSHK